MPIIVRKILDMETEWMLLLHETKKFKVHQMLNHWHLNCSTFDFGKHTLWNI